ncbi:glycoside hydrolase [Globomyces pollinis-pini]|nr:glycoside hydrolase [Globomyces pollinis-pini]
MSYYYRLFRRQISVFRVFLLALISILIYEQFNYSDNRTLKDSQSSIEKTKLKSSKKPITNITSDQLKVWNPRKDRVIKSFRHCWDGYKKYAWGFDELHPLSKKGSNWFSLGLTIVDALDTAFIMEQKDIFDQATEWVRNDLSLEQTGESNVFEITIRVLGGLLSSYHLSKDQLFLDKAIELADRLMIVFQTPSSIPYSSINLKERLAIPNRFEGASTSEATTLQMEFKYLTFLTKDPKYWNAVQLVMKKVFEQDRPDGLVPVYIQPETGYFSSNDIRLGSRGDSYYEYLAKQWLLTNFTETKYLTEFRESVNGIRKRLLYMSHPNELLFIGETTLSTKQLSTKMDHLVCFLPGTLAWAATKGKRVTKETRKLLDPLDHRDLDLAEELTRSCFQIYEQTLAGLSPEIVFWNVNSNQSEVIHNPLLKYHENRIIDLKFKHQDYQAVPYDDETEADTRFGNRFPTTSVELDFNIHTFDGHNLLRPETVESLFIMYRITGKTIYREWGWKIFEAFEKHCLVSDGGYASLDDVRQDPPPKRDKMETFFVGETLKYLYLLFHDEDILPLDKYIFNTEAHPLPVFDFKNTQKDLDLEKLLIHL